MSQAGHQRAQVDEHRLIEAAVAGDMAAFRSIYDLHLGYVTRNVARLVGPAGDVEDIVQDVFINVHRSLCNYRSECAFTTWLYRLTRNVTIDHLRKRRVTTVELDDWRPLRANTDEWAKLEARSLLRTLHAALDSLTPEHKEAFFLYEIEGMKLREIADLTEESINTIAARVRRTRERLQAVLEQNAQEVADES